MKRTLFATVTLLALAPAAFAQTATQPTTMPSATPPVAGAPGAVRVPPATVPAAVTTPTTTFTTVATGADLSSNIVGLDIYNGAKDKIGTVKDIVISGGRVQAYIVGVGGFLGMGDHYVAITPSAIAITYGPTDKKWHATMNTDAAALKAAPEYKYAT